MSRLLEDPKKLPFATYDLVVYFGVGILCLPVCYWIFIEPFGSHFPSFSLPLESEFLKNSFGLLALLFGGYALGHIIAFLSSFLIEKFVHRHYGYPSDNYLKQCANKDLTFNPKVSCKQFFASPGMFAITVFHVWLAPIYLFFHLSKTTGFFQPKLPLEILEDLKKQFKTISPRSEIEVGSRWSKIMEHYVANHCASGYARLYNYLVIFGVMRSISFLAILYVWYYVGSAFIVLEKKNSEVTGFLLEFPDHWVHFLVGYLITSTVAAFCVMNFAKFNRRFFEEGVQSFYLTCPTEAEPRAAII